MRNNYKIIKIKQFQSYQVIIVFTKH